ncbi:MAG: DNA cytosine methyltransferase [Muribaculaceae bacterium]|nr:DNA cytosine methyltransferase [Muribaculaceae bacterium]
MTKGKKITAISLFSGAGGMDVGVRQAGFDILACFELDKHCCETLRENIKREKRNTVVYEGDIKSYSPDFILKELGYQVGEINLLFGGPPCQAFSQIGKQQSILDERGELLFQMIRFANVIQPQAIMIEQVKGLLTAKDLAGNRGGVFKQFISDLEELDYEAKWRVMMAADYGVPQLRERVLIVAIKKPNDFQFPKPTHAKLSDTRDLFGLPPYKTVGEAINDLGKPVMKTDISVVPDDSHYDVTPDRDRERIHGVPEGKCLSSQTHLPKEQIGRLTKKDTTKYLRLDRNRPSNTLRGGEIFYHPIEDRYLTPREYMRIHGYPDSYVLRGPIRRRTGSVRDLDQHRQVGNSVPPPLAKAVASKIKEILLCPKSLNC